MTDWKLSVGNQSTLKPSSIFTIAPAFCNHYNNYTMKT